MNRLLPVPLARRLSAPLAIALVAGFVVSPTVPASATPGVVDHFAVTASVGTVDPGYIEAGTPFNVTVEALDDGNATVTDYVGTVTFALDNVQGGESVPADYTFTGTGGDDGVHVFTDGATATLAGLRSISATDTVDGGISGNDSFDVEPNDPAQLAFGVQPTDTYSHEVMPDVTVNIQDVFGNLTGSTADVTVALDSGSFDPTSTLTQTAVAGTATFDDLQVNTPGPYTIQATSDSLTGATSDEFDILPHADLGLTMTASPDGTPGNPAVAGTDETYTVTVKNWGPDQNTSFDLSAAVPSGTTVVGGDCTGTGPVTCSGGPLISGADQSFDIVLHISSGYAGADETEPLSFTATLGATVPTQLPNNSNADGATKTFDVIARADLSLSAQTATVDSVTSFSSPFPSGNRNTITYTVTVTNGGPSDAQDVTITDTLPSQLDGPTAQICVTTALSCLPSTAYTSGTAFNLVAGTPPQFLASGATRTVVIRAQVLGTLRNGLLATGNNTVSISSPTLRTDETANSLSNVKTVSFPTVPAAPQLISADPGNGQIAIDWREAPNNGGSSVTGYDIIVQPLPSGTPRYFFRSGNVPTAGVDFSMIVPASTPFLANGTNYQVTVKARNTAGDSDASNAISTTPCLTCVIKVVSATQTVVLNTGSTGTGATCPQKGVGATATDTFVSCYQFDPNNPKAGLPLALNEGPAVVGDCDTDICIGNQRVNVNPAGEGTGVVITQYVWVDATVSTNLFGHPCSQNPCGGGNGVYVYEVFVNGTMVGTSLKNSWCKSLPLTSTATACVKSLTELNSTTAPNGKAGKGDIQILVLLKGDPKVSLSG